MQRRRSPQEISSSAAPRRWISLRELRRFGIQKSHFLRCRQILARHAANSRSQAAHVLPMLALTTATLSVALSAGDKVAVIGASGNVGKLVALRLAETYDVRGVVRNQQHERQEVQ